MIRFYRNERQERLLKSKNPFHYATLKFVSDVVMRPATESKEGNLKGTTAAKSKWHTSALAPSENATIANNIVCLTTHIYTASIFAMSYTSVPFCVYPDWDTYGNYVRAWTHMQIFGSSR